MTEGVEWKLVARFTLPIMAAQFFQQLYNAMDAVVVGNFAAEREIAFAAVGTSVPVTMLFLALAIGMSSGCGIVVAQYFGAGKEEELRRTVSTGFIVLGIMGVVLTVVGGVVSHALLRYVLAVDPEVLPAATTYFSVYCLGLVFVFVYNIVAAVLRALGDSKAMLYFLAASAVIDIFLNLLFVLVFHLDVLGVALTTVITQAAAAVIGVLYMFKKYPLLRFTKKDFRFHGDKALLIFKMGIPTTIQQCVIAFSNLAVQRLVNSYGTVNTAAFAAGMRLNSFILIPIFSFSTGLSTFAGQNLGAGLPERVSRGLRGTLVTSSLTCLAVGVISFVFARPLVSLFGVEGEAMQRAVELTRFTAPALLIFCFYIVINGVLQGAGDVVFVLINTLASIVIRCGSAYALVYLTPLGYSSAWVSLPINWGFALILCLLRYRFGPWRGKVVVGKAFEGLEAPTDV